TLMPLHLPTRNTVETDLVPLLLPALFLQRFRICSAFSSAYSMSPSSSRRFLPFTVPGSSGTGMPASQGGCRKRPAELSSFPIVKPFDLCQTLNTIQCVFHALPCCRTVYS